MLSFILGESDFGNCLMEQTAFTQQERFESLKAGILSASASGLVFVLLLVVHQCLLFPWLPPGWIAPVFVDPNTLVLLAMGRSLLIAAMSGFLFGVTYRYVIRHDTNPQLQSGAVLAFSWVRGLAQIDTGLGLVDTILPFVWMAVESWLIFSGCRICLNAALKRGWVIPVPSSTIS